MCKAAHLHGASLQCLSALKHMCRSSCVWCPCVWSPNPLLPLYPQSYKGRGDSFPLLSTNNWVCRCTCIHVRSVCNKLSEGPAPPWTLLQLHEWKLPREGTDTPKFCLPMHHLFLFAHPSFHLLWCLTFLFSSHHIECFVHLLLMLPLYPSLPSSISPLSPSNGKLTFLRSPPLKRENKTENK